MGKSIVTSVEILRQVTALDNVYMFCRPITITTQDGTSITRTIAVILGSGPTRMGRILNSKFLIGGKCVVVFNRSFYLDLTAFSYITVSIHDVS